MSSATLPVDTSSSDSRSANSPSLVRRYFLRLFEITDPETPWDRATWIALLALFVLWAVRMYSTWATWGNLSIDCGREMYVPAMLAQGKTLYRDVWFGYMPAAPYANSVLFRLFSLHLNVLYWAGSLSALGCAVLLFLIGKRLSSWLAGWAAGAVVLFQSFHAWHFCFPLPYSFSSVYGCLAGCLFLWCAIHASASPNRGWMTAAGCAAAIAFLLKLEFGAACYITLFLLIAARGLKQQSWKRVGKDLATALPGFILCGLVIAWMVFIAGTAFLTQENLASTWPTSFFLKTYGKVWLEKTGLAITGPALRQAAVRAVFFAGVVLGACWLLWTKRFDRRSIFLGAAFLAALLAYFAFALHGRILGFFGAIFFPQDMVLYVAIAAVAGCWCVSRAPASDRGLPVALLLTFAAFFGLRILLRNTPGGYAIYYNGPAILSFLLLARPIVPRSGRTPRAVFRTEALICLACLGVAAFYSIQYLADPSDLVPLTTERGTIRVPKQVADNYRAAIHFMKEKSSEGQSVLSIPEDTSLYFLSGTPCPTRLFLFTPGLLVPGRMTDELLREMDRQPVRYLLWSNRTFPDYGAPIFGTDYDRTFGDYLRSHYRRGGLLVPPSDLDWQVRFTLWERKPDSASQ